MPPLPSSNPVPRLLPPLPASVQQTLQAKLPTLLFRDAPKDLAPILRDSAGADATGGGARSGLLPVAVAVAAAAAAAAAARQQRHLRRPKASSAQCRTKSPR